MEKYYLFGAGNNAWGVIDFFGKEDIIAIIDNEIKKKGQQILDIPIISFSDYLEKHGDETLIITAAVYEEIEKQLLEKGIYNYYIAPMIQMGMASVQQMVEEWKLYEKDRIVMYGYNPIGRMIQRQLKECGYQCLIQVIPQKEIEKTWAKKDDIQIIPLESIDHDVTLITFATADAEQIRKENPFIKNIFNIFELVMESNKKANSCLKQWKDIHKGETCFIVGNGPSLKMEDLERIRKSGIASFGMNLIYNIYESTNWRPTYYVFAEYNVIRQYYDEIKRLKRNNLFMKNFYYMDDTPQLDEVNYYPGCGERCYCEQQRFSEDISSVVYGGYSVMYDALQIAIYMGYKKIYLLGADFSYLGDPAQKGNHFYDDKTGDKRLVAGKPHIYITVAAMEKAKEFADGKGVEIYNATRGGKLEVFPRIDIETLI